MKNYKRAILQCLSLLMILSMLLTMTSCGNSTGNKANTDNKPSAAAATPTPTAAQNKQISFKGKELNVLVSAAPFTQSLQPFVKEFEEKMGVKVNFTLLGRNNYDDKTLIELSSGSSASDVYYSFDDSFYQFVSNDWLQPLDSLITNKDLTDNSEFNQPDFLEGPYKAGNVQGKQYAIPVHTATCLLYYRKDLFEKAGIKGAPKTWEELEEAAKKLKALGVAGMAMRGAKGMGGSMWHFPMFFYSFGGKIYTDFPNDMHPVVNTPEFINAAKFFSKLLNDYGIKGAITSNYEDITLAVQQGDLGMWIDGAPLVKDYENPQKSKASGKIGYAVIPAGPKGITAAQTNHFLVINKNSKEKELAWKFIQWATSKEMFIKLATKGSHVAGTRKSLFEDEAYLKVNNFGNGDWSKAYKESLNQYAVKYYYPLTKEWSEVVDTVSSALSEVMAGQKKAEDAFNEANKKLDSIMKKAGYYK